MNSTHRRPAVHRTRCNALTLPCCFVQYTIREEINPAANVAWGLTRRIHRCCRGRPSSNGRRRSSAARRAEHARADASRRRRHARLELRSRESFAEASPHELADAHVVDVADGASELAAEEVHEVKAEARSSRDFSRELGDFFDGLGPVAYAQEASLPDDESDDETKTPS